jgi:hypothetical protein
MDTFSSDVNCAMISMVCIPRLADVDFHGMRRMSTWYGCCVWLVHFLGCDAGGMIMPECYVSRLVGVSINIGMVI